MKLTNDIAVSAISGHLDMLDVGMPRRMYLALEILKVMLARPDAQMFEDPVAKSVYHADRLIQECS